MDIVKAIQKSLALITHHIGLGGDAHPNATARNAGFMPPDLFKSAESLFNKRIQLSEGTDIMKLTQGFYEGAGLLNHPDFGATTASTRISLINVIYGDGGRKTIEVIDSFNNHHWTITQHTDGTPDDEQARWTRVNQYSVLWSGYSDLSNPVTLSQPLVAANGVRNFNEIEVKFVTSSNDTVIGNIDAVALGGSLDATTIINGDRISITTYEGYLELTNSTAVLTNNWGLNIYPNVNDEHDARIQIVEQSKMYILEIRGIR